MTLAVEKSPEDGGMARIDPVSGEHLPHFVGIQVVEGMRFGRRHQPRQYPFFPAASEIRERSGLCLRNPGRDSRRSVPGCHGNRQGFRTQPTMEPVGKQYPEEDDDEEKQGQLDEGLTFRTETG